MLAAAVKMPGLPYHQRQHHQNDGHGSYTVKRERHLIEFCPVSGVDSNWSSTDPGLF